MVLQNKYRKILNIQESSILTSWRVESISYFQEAQDLGSICARDAQ